MPYYEFFCENCNEEFETYIHYSAYDTTNVACPRCLKFSVKRKYDIPVVAFVGDGFYSTDNRSEDRET